MHLRSIAPIAVMLALVACAPAADARKLGSRPLGPGATGSDVKTLQRALTALDFRARPWDGVYGKRTSTAVRRWKRVRKVGRGARLTRGQGRRVRRELLRERRRRKTVGASVAVGPGRNGPTTAQVQGDLQRLSFFSSAIDGICGPVTTAAIKAYQGAFRARQTGTLTAAAVARLRARANAGRPAGAHVFPILGSYTFGGEGGRFGAARGGHAHQGQDMAAAQNTPVVAVHPGTITARSYQASGAGNYIVLAADDGYDYVYMHLAQPGLVPKGARVGAGQQIGLVGSTGRSSGPHLHFESWTAHWYAGGSAFDPLPSLLSWR